VLSLALATAAESLNAWGVLATLINTDPIWTAFTMFGSGFLALIDESAIRQQLTAKEVAKLEES
jgi:hypothetical protein